MSRISVPASIVMSFIGAGTPGEDENSVDAEHRKEIKRNAGRARGLEDHIDVADLPRAICAGVWSVVE